MELDGSKMPMSTKVYSFGVMCYVGQKLKLNSDQSSTKRSRVTGWVH